MPPCAYRVHLSRSDSSSREVSARASLRWHSLQSALFSSTTISATCSPHASQMTTLATSFAIGDFVARDSWACPGFPPFRRSDSASGYPFGNENNYVCRKRTGDRRLNWWTLSAAVPPQNPVDGAIVDVSALGVKLAYPDAPLAVRPACDRWNTENGGAELVREQRDAGIPAWGYRQSCLHVSDLIAKSFI